jgi:hypothetical protein
MSAAASGYTRGSEQMGQTACEDRSGCEDGQSHSAFHQVSEKRVKGEAWRQEEPERENCKVLQSERHGGEIKRQSDVSAGGDKGASGQDDDGLAQQSSRGGGEGRGVDLCSEFLVQEITSGAPGTDGYIRGA